MSELTITHEPHGDKHVLRLEGVLRPIDAEDFDAEISKVVLAGPSVLVLDLSKLRFIGSAGIGALVRLAKAMQKHETRVRVAAASPEIETLFEQSRLDDMFPMFDTLESALG